MDWAGGQYEVEFLKKKCRWSVDFFGNYVFHDRGRRGRSRRENHRKPLSLESYPVRQISSKFYSGVKKKRILQLFTVRHLEKMDLIFRRSQAFLL